MHSSGAARAAHPNLQYAEATSGHAHLAGRGCPLRMASASSAGMRSSGRGSSSPSSTASKRAPIMTAGEGNDAQRAFGLAAGTEASQ